MESSQHLETKFQIPYNQIYKVFMFDEGGKVTRVHIFCANTKNEKDLPSLFSELELAYFKEENIEFVFSDLLLHSDDTIRNVKHKIIHELINYHKDQEEFMCSPEELYLFSSKEMQIDFSEVFLQITQNKRETITKEEFYYYSSLLQLDPLSLESNKDGFDG